jgi:hypothetical protein
MKEIKLSTDKLGEQSPLTKQQRQRKCCHEKNAVTS